MFTPKKVRDQFWKSKTSEELLSETFQVFWFFRGISDTDSRQEIDGDTI